jgi:Domain of unknown function (DUF5017)
MKKYLPLLMLTLSLGMLLASCNKYEDNEMPSGFQVTTQKLTYKVNDSVLFNFNSGPDEIIFYSGEPGKRYENQVARSEAGINKLIFQSAMQNGVLINNDSMRLLVSVNLAGYDSASIVNATWTDITSRNTKWPTVLSTVFTTSDSVDISDFNNAGLINIAFRAIGKQYAAAAQRKWQIQNLALGNRLVDGTVTPLFATPLTSATTVTASAFQYTGWVQASIKNNTLPGFNAWNVGTGGISTADSIRNSNGIIIRTTYPIQFDPGTTVNNPDNDDWLITTKVNLKTVRPDAGVTIKNEVNAAFPGMNYLFNKIPGVYAQYLYFFKTPGVYNITFVAANLNNNRIGTVVKQLQITITP